MNGELLKCSLWNVTSMVHKTDIIMEHILDRDSDIVFLTETWLTSDFNHVTAMVKTYGYKLLHSRRKNRQKETGGGVGVLVKLNIEKKQLKSKMYTSFEHTMVKIFLTNKKSVTLLCIYRLLFVSVVIFLEEFTHLLESIIAVHECMIVAGDVNIHTEAEEFHSKQFANILDMFDMTQHVREPTYRMGHTLDIVATFNKNPNITNVVVNEYDISHHFLVDFLVTLNPDKREYKTITYRNIKAVDCEKFSNEITQKWNELLPLGSFGEKVTKYNNVLEKVLKEHAPQKTRTIKIVPESPWFDADYENIRKLRRKAEKKFRKTGLKEHHDNYVKLRKETTSLAYAKKKDYYEQKLNSASNNKTLYTVVNQLLDNKQETILPTAKSDKELAESFVHYFSEKISKIRSKFPETVKSCTSKDASNLNVQCLSVFEGTTEDEILQIVTSYGIKCSPEDPIPAKLLQTNLPTFIPKWTELVNISLAEGSMECLKNAIILPLIKEMDEVMDCDVLKNYRPVSNLVFLEKLIERIVSIRLNRHMTDNNLHSNHQYGYKKSHSTETLLVKVLNDLLISCDEKKPTILMLLDLSAAFDTVDQVKLLDILQKEIRIEGAALNWFKSFLMERTQRVKINDSYSYITKLLYGVAQGSVLGPDLFNIYVRSLYPYIKPSLFSIFGFADDHQLMKTFVPILQVRAFEDDVNRCLQLISSWMNDFFLCLNPTKTKILVVRPHTLTHCIIMNGTFVNNNCIRFVKEAKNLGVILDDTLTFEQQITQVVKSCILTIKKLAKIKSFLSYQQLRTLVSTCIFSKIDYCNSLYIGINAALIKKLQSVQNSAVQLIRKRQNQTHLSTREYLKKFHWLPVKERIVFKLLLLVHKCMIGNAPESLSNLLQFGGSSRTNKLEEPRSNGVYGDRSFSRAGPKLWNLLPANIRMQKDTEKFKTNLKTFLFEEPEKLLIRN